MLDPYPKPAIYVFRTFELAVRCAELAVVIHVSERHGLHHHHWHHFVWPLLLLIKVNKINGFYALQEL